MKRKTEIFSRKSELVSAAANRILVIVETCLSQKERCTMALAGGSTPRDVYKQLAHKAKERALNWHRVKLFWGDERTVPPHDQESNFRMVQESLLPYIDIPSENVFRMRGEIDPSEAASEYADLLRAEFKTDPPQFDLALLGVGNDGHTASLFPGTEAVESQQDLAMAVFVEKLNTWRITLTLPVFNAARNVIFLLSGRSKSDIVPLIVDSDKPSKEWPATLIRPHTGNVFWMMDAAAATNYHVLQN